MIKIGDGIQDTGMELHIPYLVGLEHYTASFTQMEERELHGLTIKNTNQQCIQFKDISILLLLDISFMI